MKNVTTSIILFLILNFSIKAQKVETYRYGGGGTNSGLRRLDNQETEIKGLDGSSYYDNAWRIGSFKLLSNNTLKDKLIKYNIRKNIIEVKDNNEIKTFSAGNISELIWLSPLTGNTEVLRNVAVYGLDDIGFFVVLNEGKKAILLKKPYLETIKPNYITALDIGEEDPQIVKKKKFYVYKDSELRLLKPRKKEILKLFKDNEQLIKQYISNNNINLRNETDLIKLFRFYETLN